MSTIKVDTIKNRSSAINLPNNFKIGGSNIVQGYTSSGSEPGSPSTGDFWWDSSNDKLYRYIDGGFKELSTASASNPWSGDRALASGRAVSGHYNEIQRFDITTAGNSVDFGDLINNTTTYFSSTGSSARGLFVGGYDSGLSGRTNVIQYVTPSSPGNAQDFGDLSLARQPRGATSNGTRAVFSGGLHGGGYFTNTIDYITVASAGNATDFGDTVIAEPARGTQGTVGDATRGLFANAAGNSDRNIDYFTYASPGNATDFGDLVLYGGMVAG